jgi:uncharacterized membrane protein YbhN (UPF0104 family)
VSLVGYFEAILKFLIVPGFLIFMIAEIQEIYFGKSTLVIDWSVAILSLTLHQFALLLFAIRMRQTLLLFNIRISQYQSIRISLQSMFYYFLVPMSAGIEVARYVKLRKLQPELTSVQLSVAVLADRAVGLLSVIVLLLCVLPNLVTFNVSSGLLWTLLSFIILVLILSLAVCRSTWFKRVISLIDSNKGLLRSHALLPLLTSLLSTFFSAIALWSAAVALGVESSFVNILAGFLIAILGTAVPIGFFGVGAGEALGGASFIALGFGFLDALMLVTIGYAFRLYSALQGGVLEIVDGIISIISKKKLT